jgi:hypothetical protein
LELIILGEWQEIQKHLASTSPNQYTGGRRGDRQSSNIIEGASEIISLRLSLGTPEHEDEHKSLPLQITIKLLDFRGVDYFGSNADLRVFDRGAGGRASTPRDGCYYNSSPFSAY